MQIFFVPYFDTDPTVLGRENHKPGIIGRKNVKPRNNNAADKAAATEIPSILSINTALASKVPSPPGTKLTVRMTFANMKVANAWLGCMATPNDRTRNQS